MFDWSTVCGARPAVMGIVNVTPDSFSDGGQCLDPDAAVAHGLALVAAGADLLDVGGESTRPGAEPVGEEEETRRVLPVVRALAIRAGVPVSVDTTKAGVAAAALEAGAVIVNDVSAGSVEPAIMDVVAAHGAGYVAVHMLGTPQTMQDDPRYGDVVDDVGGFLVERIAAARDAGMAAPSIAADPGFGFGKTVGHNLTLLAHMARLVQRLEVPLLVGTSRKRFLGAVLAADGGPRSDAVETVPAERDDATLATVVWCVDQGARIVRVHEARSAVRAVALLQALEVAA